jgi:hypothetical protein
MKMLTSAGALVALIILFLSITPAPSAETAGWTFHNNTRDSIGEVHIVANGSPNWGGDWMRGNSIESGASQTFRVPIGVYDVRFETDGGIVCTYRNQAHTGAHTWNIVASWFNNRNNCRQD